MTLLANAHSLFCCVHLESLQKQASNVFFFYFLPTSAFSFPPFIADKRSSSTTAECLCSGYFRHRCPHLFSLFFKLCSTLHTGPRPGFHCPGIDFLFFLFEQTFHFLRFQRRCRSSVYLCFRLCVGSPLDWLYFNARVVTFTETSFVKSEWKEALNLKFMLGNRSPWLPFLFSLLPKTTRDLYLQWPSFFPLSLHVHNETFVSQKLLVRIALLNVFIRNVISPDHY